MTDWQPDRYLQFADERTRPARDLLAQVPLTQARHVFDLGCGPGNSTALLLARFPAAEVTGIDNSPAMLEAARAACPGARFRFADLAVWEPEVRPDLLYSNATFQWVPHHPAVLERVAGSLPAGGVLAVLEFGLPTFPPARWVHRLYTERIMPFTATLIARDRSGAYKYLPRSVDTFLSPEGVAEAAAKAGFADVQLRRLTMGTCALTTAVRRSV